ncbi:MAG: PilW family protein [Candidatus Omnitrophota bacterium]
MLGNKAFTLVEVLISVFVFTVVAAGLYIVLAGGQSTWHTTEVSVQLQQNLRQALQRVTRELHESGFDSADVAQVTIQEGAGLNNSDILQFKVPGDWDLDGDILDGSNHLEWGSYLQWGSFNPACGASPSCKNFSVQYFINSDGRFQRQVLNDTGSVVRTDTLAERITDFQAARNGNIVSLQLTSQRNTVFGRSITSILRADVLLRNRG